MTAAVMDVVMKMRRVSLTRRFLSAPPQCSGRLESLEKQERLSKMEFFKLKGSRKCWFIEILQTNTFFNKVKFIIHNFIVIKRNRLMKNS